MKKNFITIIALLVTTIISAQSKNELLKEFQNLEEKLGEVNLKYDKKLQKFQGNTGDEMVYEDIKEDDLSNEDFKEFGKESGNLSEDSSVVETMKMFVEMYDGNAENKKMYAEFENEGDKKLLTKDKDYLKIVKAYEDETAKIEKKMYEIAKKYLAKK